MRCPVCFSRDIDVLMIPTGNAFHYCPKCSFSGRESEVRGFYRDIQKKYHWMGRRVTLEEQRAL
mgnify:CR=1 FL=1|jgi:hypothetical protein